MISIITPCKNIIAEGRKEFFRKMMDSLSRQSYTDYEHIVIDGASRDGTSDLLEEYVSAGLINRVISEPDNNLHEAINKGLKLAKGEFIYIMNSEDYFANDHFFEESVNTIKKLNIDFTHGDRLIIKRDGSKPSVKKGDARAAFFRMPFRWQSMLIRKTVYDELGPLDESYSIASDYKFMMKMILEGKKGFYMPKILIHSLDGGITKDRQKCVEEVTAVLFDTYGKKYGLSIDECREIYLRRITPELYHKILSKVDNSLIKDSLSYCYNIVQKLEKSGIDYVFPQVPLENFSSGICNVQIPELGEQVNGKIRNNWVINGGSDSQDLRVIVTTDFQYAMGRLICSVPFKGAASNLLSAYWFDKTRDIIKNHMIAVPYPNVMIAHQVKLVFPVEIVVRKFMARSNTPTSIYYNYYIKSRRKIYGLDFHEGLLPNQEFPNVIITPTTKDPSGEDKELSDSEARMIVDSLSFNGAWEKIKEASLRIFDKASAECGEKGLILADTKMEFGLDHDGEIMLVDELLTPDCSRYWLKSTYLDRLKRGLDPELWKDFIQEYLDSKGFTGTGEIPIIGDDTISKLSSLHVTPYRMITGNEPDCKMLSAKEVGDNVISFLNKTKILKPK